jgi:hypothetical protein
MKGSDHDSDETCSMCGKTLSWHVANSPRHPFNAPSRYLNEKDQLVADDPTPPPLQVMPAMVPFDPALRMALINAGVITPEQIEEAAKLLRTVSSMGGQSYEPPHFSPPDQSGN